MKAAEPTLADQDPVFTEAPGAQTDAPAPAAPWRPLRSLLKPLAPSTTQVQPITPSPVTVSPEPVGIPMSTAEAAARVQQSAPVAPQSGQPSVSQPAPQAVIFHGAKLRELHAELSIKDGIAELNARGVAGGTLNIDENVDGTVDCVLRFHLANAS